MMVSGYPPFFAGYTYVSFQQLPSSFTLTQTSTGNVVTYNTSLVQYGGPAVVDGTALPALTLTPQLPASFVITLYAPFPVSWYALNSSQGYFRHANSNIWCTPYSQTLDFAWAFYLQNGTTNQIKIYNGYFGACVQSGLFYPGRLAIGGNFASASVYTISNPINLNAPLSSMSGKPLLSQLSVAPVAAFSLRAVNGLSTGGTAKAVQVRRASDNATQDFYADRLGNLLTAPVTGQSLDSWLNSTYYYTADTSTSPLAISFSGTAGTVGILSNVSDYSMKFPGVLGSFLFFSDSRFTVNPWWQNGGFTFEAWVNYTSFTNTLGNSAFPISFGTMLAGPNQGGNNGPNWTFGPNTSGFLIFYYNTGVNQLVTASAAMVTGKWYHTCVQCDGTNIYIYLDGLRVASQALVLTPGNAVSAFAIGQWNGQGLPGPNFLVGDLRLVHRGTVYATAGFTAPSAPLSVYTTGGAVTALLIKTSATGYVATWYDQSGAGNNATQGTPANQPQIQKGTKGPGYMILFSGNQYLTGFSYTVLNNTNYTICMCERRTASLGLGVNTYSDNPIMSCGTATGSTDGYLHNTYRSGIYYLNGQYSDDERVTVTAFATASTEPIRYGFTLCSSTSGRNIYVYNDALGAPIKTQDTAAKNQLTMTAGSLSIGSVTFGGTTYYVGEMYEILIFKSSFYDTDGTTSTNVPNTITQIYNNQLSYTGT
jgi:hypothetical protein